MSKHAPPDPYQPQRPYGPPAQMPPGHRSTRESWPRRHRNLTALGGILGLWVVAGVATAALSGGGHPAAPAEAKSTAAPAATQHATAEAAAKPKATAKPKVAYAPRAHARDAEDACDARGFASGDIYVRMIVPGLAPVAQELGGEWTWDIVARECLTSVQFIIAAAPQTPGNCTQVGYVADNPGYDPNATPAAPLKEVTAETGPAC